MENITLLFADGIGNILGALITFLVILSTLAAQYMEQRKKAQAKRDAKRQPQQPVAQEPRVSSRIRDYLEPEAGPPAYHPPKEHNLATLDHDSERLGHLPEHLGHLPEHLEHLPEHNVGQIADVVVPSRQSTSPADQFALLLANKADLRQAVVLSEILHRPEERWE